LKTESLQKSKSEVGTTQQRCEEVRRPQDPKKRAQEAPVSHACVNGDLDGTAEDARNRIVGVVRDDAV
jgi:hypothetical protein